MAAAYAVYTVMHSECQREGALRGGCSNGLDTFPFSSKRCREIFSTNTKPCFEELSTEIQFFFTTG